MGKRGKGRKGVITGKTKSYETYPYWKDEEWEAGYK